MELSKNNYWIDANIFLRYITADNKIQSKKTEKFVSQFTNLNSRGFVNTLVLHEVVYVLEKVYHFSRSDIAKNVYDFVAISNIEIIDLEKESLKKALTDFKTKKVDFPDCVYKQIALNSDFKILSFDKDYKKIGFSVAKI